jgi:hypothetical protein
MSKTMASWFFMRSGFTTFRLEPDQHPEFLFGNRERQKRDLLLEEIEGASFSNDGHKAVIFGDYGRGKTRMCHNLAYEIGRNDLTVIPLYIKCSSYTSKEPFPSLFKELVGRHSTDAINRIASEYVRRMGSDDVPPLVDIVQSEDIALVMSRGLTAVDHDVVRNSMRWLGGDAKVPMGLISQALKPQLTDSREFGAVMRGLSQMLITVEHKVPLYLIDEAERFQNVANVDTYWSWLAALRELTEIVNAGFMFFIGANTRNDLPTILVQEEVMRRIGVANYMEFQNPGRDDLREFLLELLGTFIRKGEAPEPHRSILSDAARDSAVPQALIELTEGDSRRLETYPFEPDAFDEFVEQLTASDKSSKPSEALIRLQKAAQRAMRTDVRLIDTKMVTAVGSEGF